MTTKKSNTALVVRRKGEVAGASKTPELLAASAPRLAQSAQARDRKRVAKTALSKPTALNLYPEDLDKIDMTVAFLKSKGCRSVSKSRVGQLAIRALQLNEETVSAFQDLPDYRNREES